MSQQLDTELAQINKQVKAQQDLLTRLKEATTDASENREQNYLYTLQQAQQTYNEGLAHFNELAEQERNNLRDEIDALISELADAKKKRDAVNQEIMRQRELEEKEDFYKIQLTQDDIDDIALLQSVRTKLHKTTSLDKLIYDLYVAKPVNEMIKRVLNGKAPSGIYKITRIKTGEVYIGKSTDVKARWQQHAKACFHFGTISHSILHTTMERDGIDQFTWELLEEVPKDKLSEREKYYIQYYDSTNYGLNERIG